MDKLVFNNIWQQEDFMSKKMISAFLAFTMILSVISIGVFADDSKISFTDVDASTAEGVAIYKLVENGIVSGNGDGTFTPNNFVTRAELCKMVNNIWKLTEPADQGFWDVTEDKWYFKHVLIGKKAGYINGFDDGSFRGDDYVTREQACAIICRISGLKDVAYTQTIADEVSDWAVNDVKKILGNKLMTLEEGNKFRATENMKRGVLAKVLANFVDSTTSGTVVNPSGGTTGGSVGGTTGGITGGSVGGPTGGSVGGPTGGGIGGSTGGKPTVDYTQQNASIVANLKVAKSELTDNRALFTEPEKEIIDIVIGVLTNLIASQDKYIISTETVYTAYVEDILEAMEKYKEFNTSDRSSFVSKISRLNSTVFNFLEEFFGIDLSDIDGTIE